MGVPIIVRKAESELFPIKMGVANNVHLADKGQMCARDDMLVMHVLITTSYKTRIFIAALNAQL